MRNGVVQTNRHLIPDTKIMFGKWGNVFPVRLLPYLRVEAVLCEQVGLLLPRVPAAGQGVGGGEVRLTADVLWCFWWIYRGNKTRRY